MSAKAEDLTIEYEEDGLLLTKVIDKRVLSAGAWATVIFRYQLWDKRTESYTDDRYTIRRYRKTEGDYRQQSKFNISSNRQAKKLIAVLNDWIGDA